MLQENPVDRMLTISLYKNYRIGTTMNDMEFSCKRNGLLKLSPKCFTFYPAFAVVQLVAFDVQKALWKDLALYS